MAHIQSIPWDTPGSLPLFFERIWPLLTVEWQWALFRSIGYLLSNIDTSMRTTGDGSPMRAFPTPPVQQTSSLEWAKPSPRLRSAEPDPSLPLDASFLTIQGPLVSSAPRHQQTLCQLAENTTTSRPLLRPASHARKPTTKDGRQRPVSEQLPKKPVTTIQQHARPRRSKRVVTTTASPSADLPATAKTDRSTPYLLFDASTTLNVLAQPSRGSFQPPFLGKDVLNVLSQNAFSTANVDDTLRIIFESAAAFFEHHGSTLKTCKDIIDIRYKTGETATSTTIALRLHSQALVMLRDHSTNDFAYASNKDVKSCFVDGEIRSNPTLQRPEAIRNLTTEFKHGAKYAILRKKFCRAVTTRLNPKKNYVLEERPMNDEVEESFKREGAPTLHKLMAIANRNEADPEILDSDVLLEIICMIFLSYLYWKYHDCYYPEGCESQSCLKRKRMRTAQLHEPSTENSDERETEPEYTVARLSCVFNNDGGETLATLTLGGEGVVVFPPSAPADETSLSSILSQSRKRPGDSDVCVPPEKRMTASTSRAGTSTETSDNSNLQPPDKNRTPALAASEPWNDLDFPAFEQYLTQAPEASEPWNDLDFPAFEQYLTQAPEASEPWNDLDFPAFEQYLAQNTPS